MASGLVNSNRTVPLVEALPWKSKPLAGPDAVFDAFPPEDAAPEPPVALLDELEVVLLLDALPADWLVLDDEGVLLATLVEDEVPLGEPVVGAVDAPALVERGVAAVDPELLVELVEPLLMRVLADVVLDAAVAVVPVAPPDEELDEPSSTHADRASDAASATNHLGFCAAEG